MGANSCSAIRAAGHLVLSKCTLSADRLTLGIALFASGLAAWGWLTRPAPPEPGVATRSEVTGIDPAFAGRKLAISPDGRWIVANRRTEEVERALFIRGADDLEWRLLANTQFGQDPVFSPDGRSVAFVQGEPGA